MEDTRWITHHSKGLTTCCAALEEKFVWLRDEWAPLFEWKRGSRIVLHDERQFIFLQYIQQGLKATINRIKAGDVSYAREYSAALARLGVRFLKGEL